MLHSLHQAVSKALERKRRLGQYAVIWDQGKPVMRHADAIRVADAAVPYGHRD
jgi:hypothetical protein